MQKRGHPWRPLERSWIVPNHVGTLLVAQREQHGAFRRCGKIGRENEFDLSTLSYLCDSPLSRPLSPSRADLQGCFQLCFNPLKPTGGERLGAKSLESASKLHPLERHIRHFLTSSKAKTMPIQRLRTMT
jgi:hypothetical protein